MDACKFDAAKIREIVRSEMRFLILELRGAETQKDIDRLLGDLDREKESRERNERMKGEQPNGK